MDSERGTATQEREFCKHFPQGHMQPSFLPFPLRPCMKNVKFDEERSESNGETYAIQNNLKVHKIENFFGSDFEFCVI